MEEPRVYIFFFFKLPWCQVGGPCRGKKCATLGMKDAPILIPYL